MKRKPWEPEQMFSEYEAGRTFKAGLGRHGLYEQSKTNERFYVGDQWYGARCGNDRPLVRHNVIKRIGDYKMAVVSANPVTVNYSAEGVPNTLTMRDVPGRRWNTWLSAAMRRGKRPFLYRKRKRSTSPWPPCPTTSKPRRNG